VVFLGRNLANFADEVRAAHAEGLVERPGALRRSDALRLIRQAEANLIFLTDRPGSPYYTDVPQKLYEYIAAQRPIIAIGPASSETAEVLRASGLATFADTPPAIARCLDEVEPHAVAPDVLARYSYERIASRYADILRSAAG